MFPPRIPVLSGRLCKECRAVSSMVPTPRKCRRLAFSGTYNLVDDSEDLSKYARFASILCNDGALFYPDNNRAGRGPWRSQQEITKEFTRSASDNWIGRLVV